MPEEGTRIEGKDGYYRAAIHVLKTSKRIVCASKTPTVLIPQEQDSGLRREYYEKALKWLDAGGRMEFVISLPDTMQEFVDLSKKDPARFDEGLRKWRELVKNPKFNVYYLREKPTAFNGFYAGDGNVAVPVRDPKTGKSAGAVLHSRQHFQRHVDEFNALRKNAENDHEKIIAEIRAKAGR